MSTTTTRLALIKPDPNPTTGDDVDVSEINTNSDIIDANIGWVICTSSTRPGSPWDGMGIYETDTDRFYVRAESAWNQIVGVTGSILNAGVKFSRAAAGDDIVNSKVTGDTQDRLVVDTDGAMLWGSGSATGDTKLYRSAADTLKTDDSMIVAGSLSVTGPLITTPAGGNVNAKAGVQTVVANTTTLTALATMTFPASEPAVATSVWVIRLWCRASVTGTPTLTIRSRLGGTATTAAPVVITASSGVTDHPVCIEAVVAFSAVGAGSGVARVITTVTEALSVSGSGPFTSVVRQDLPSSMTSLNTTAGTLVFDVTVQWGTANALNTITVNAAEVARIA